MKRLCTWATLVCIAAGCSSYEQESFRLVIFHTNDRHSHFLGLPNGNYRGDASADGTLGGAARLIGLVEAARSEEKEVLLVDAGDFTMGTLFVAARNNAADLDFLKRAGYTAATIGNHELDWSEAGLARMIAAAEKPTVPLLASNIRFNADSPEDDALAALYGEPGQKDKYIFPYYLHRTERGTRVGFIGLLGVGATADSNARAASFSRDVADMAAQAQPLIDRLRLQEGAQVVVCLAHLGTEMQGDELAGGESLELAKKTSGIDVIISGHTHTDTGGAHAVKSERDPQWTTWVAEADHYALRLGKVVITQQAGERTVESTSLPIDDRLPPDAGTLAFIDTLRQDLEQNFLASLPRKPAAGAFLDGTLGQVLSHAPYDLLRRDYENGNLGYLVADAMREACHTPVAFASNGGDLRASLPRSGANGFSLQDTFIVTPLGTGQDGRLGYPLARYYLRLVEIKLLLEATVCDMGQHNNDYMINLSGLRIVINTSTSGSYNCVRRITLTGDAPENDPGTVLFDAAGGGFKQDQMTLLQVCSSSYIADKMARFNVYPKDAAGNNQPIEQVILKEDGREIKLWYAVAGKLASRDPVPDMYNESATANPYGPYYRRAWDVNRHGCQDHPYCR